MKSQITDRAKRYRAHGNAEEIAPRVCFFCLASSPLDLDHITGNEADEEPENLMYLCRSCNTTKGYIQARNKIGVRTAQFNPEPARGSTLERFKHAASILLGKIKGDAGKATAYIRKLGHQKRREIIEKMRDENPFKSAAQRRKFYAMAERGEITPATLKKFARKTPPGQLPEYVNPVTFAQYGRAVAEHRRGAHDEGGAIIHATPPATRSRYAREIARIKKQRGTAEVPF